MPSNYSGNPNNITTPLTRSVISCSSGAGGLVLVGTSGAHLFSTYDYVQVTGVTGTTEANTATEIQVISSTSFLLTGVSFVNAYSSGGTAKDLSLTPYFQVPDDGEYATADSIEASIEAIADRTQYLAGALNVPIVCTSDTNMFAPPGATRASVYMYPGGGGGGGGGAGFHDGGAVTSGGGGAGGGGGGVAIQAVVNVTAGVQYTASPGTGGAGGAATVTGSSGGDSVFKIAGGATLMRANGAAGGAGGTAATADVTPGVLGSGGRPFATLSSAATDPGCGGAGANGGAPTVNGGSGSAGFGANGTAQATLGGGAHGSPGGGGTFGGGTVGGGGAGGGGGASGNPQAVNGSMGVGGDGGSGNGGSATAGSAAANGCGGGGGGGGAGGAGGLTPAGLGGVGGAGGNGLIVVTWLR